MVQLNLSMVKRILFLISFTIPSCLFGIGYAHAVMEQRFFIAFWWLRPSGKDYLAKAIQNVTTPSSELPQTS